MRLSSGIILLAALALSPGMRAAAADGDQGGASGSVCVNVQIGNERVPDFDCINRQFRLQVEHIHTGAPVPVAPIDAHSSSITVGTANTAAAQQMMGNAFGKSAQPQRPPPPTFVPSLPRVGAH